MPRSATHPQLFLSPVKEPKYFLCDGRPPAGQRGPGDAHSAREWIWRRAEYEALFDGAPSTALKGESTPFYLYDRGAHTRLATAVPGAKLIVIVRDPVERAYSNWTHLWSDGLEPISDFATAWAAEDERIRRDWAPFWHYRRLGLYGEQLRDLLEVFPRSQVHVLRYRDMVDAPDSTLDAICTFLGVALGVAHTVPAENVHPFVRPSARAAALGAAVRAGAAVGRARAPAALAPGLGPPDLGVAAWRWSPAATRGRPAAGAGPGLRGRRQTARGRDGRRVRRLARGRGTGRVLQPSGRRPELRLRGDAQPAGTSSVRRSWDPSARLAS